MHVLPTGLGGVAGSMTATALLSHQHGRLIALIAALRTDKTGRVRLLLELVDELTAHLTIASYFVYGLARDAGVPLDRYYRSHATLRSALKRVVHAEADDTAFEREITYLESLLDIHVHAEERELLPATERAVPRRDLDALGTRMETFYAATLARVCAARDG